jgi:hypothetical protein
MENMITRKQTIIVIVIALIASLGAYLALQNIHAAQTTSLTPTTSYHSTTSSNLIGSTSNTATSSLFSSTSKSTSSTSTTSTLSNSSIYNLCFINNFDDNITFINSIYYECSANLNVSQSIKQNVLGPAFSSPQLVGKYVLSINASYNVSVGIVQNGTTVSNESGTSISYTGNIAPGGYMYFTITNEGTIMNTYEFGISFSNQSVGDS